MADMLITVPVGTRVKNPHAPDSGFVWFVGDQRPDGTVPVHEIANPTAPAAVVLQQRELLDANPKLLINATGTLAAADAAGAVSGGWRVVAAPPRSDTVEVTRSTGEHMWTSPAELTSRNPPFALHTVEPMPSDIEAGTLIARQRGARVVLTSDGMAPTFAGTEATATGDARRAAGMITDYLDWLRTTTGRNGLDGAGGSVPVLLNARDHVGNAAWSLPSAGRDSVDIGSMVLGAAAGSETPYWHRGGVVAHELTHGLQRAMFGHRPLAPEDAEALSASRRFATRTAFEERSVNEGLADVGGALLNHNWRPGSDPADPSLVPARDIPKLRAGAAPLTPLAHDKAGLDALWARYIDAAPGSTETHYDTSTIVSHTHFRIQQHIGWERSDQLLFATLDQMAQHKDTAGLGFQGWADAARNAARVVLDGDATGLAKTLAAIKHTGF